MVFTQTVIVSLSRREHKIEFWNNLLHCARTCCYRISMQRAARLLSHLFRRSNRRYAFNFICPLLNNTHISSPLWPFTSLHSPPPPHPSQSRFDSATYSISVASFPKIAQTTGVTNLWYVPAPIFDKSNVRKQNVQKWEILIKFPNQILTGLFVLTNVQRNYGMFEI